MSRLLIAVATCNRPFVTELSLGALRQILGPDDALIVYDDASDAYGAPFLRRFADDVIRMPSRGGIERLRARNFRDFDASFREYDLMYTTDNDTIHDPAFSARLRELYALGAAGRDEALPVCLYRSRFHDKEQNVVWRSDDLGGISLRRTAPGVSQLFDRAMAARIVDGLAQRPALESTYGYDYHLPALLERPFLQSEVSYLEHFARDAFEGGLHATNSGRGADAMADFERDRAINPTPYLQQLRPIVIEYILNAGGAAPGGAPRSAQAETENA